MDGEQMTEQEERAVTEERQRRIALEHHLGYNHFPPIPADFVDSAEAALDALAAGDPSRKITMPNTIVKQAWEIAEGMHLEPFLPDPEDE